MQYSRLCYRLLIEEKFTTGLRDRAAVIAGLGSVEQQESLFRRLGMLNDVFELLRKQGEYKKAYRIGVEIGFLEDSFQLLIDNSLLEWACASSSDLIDIFNYLRARNLLARMSPIREHGRVTHTEHATAGLISAGLTISQLTSSDELWKSLDKVLNSYPWSDDKPDRNHLQDELEQMRIFLDLLVRKFPAKYELATTI